MLNRSRTLLGPLIRRHASTSTSSSSSSISSQLAPSIPQTASPDPSMTLRPSLPIPKSIPQPVGAFRGGLIGFLLGLTAVGTYGYYLLLSDYSLASTKLLSSIEQLELSTTLISNQLEKIHELEQRLQSFEKQTVEKKELKSLRDEYRKLWETSHLDGVNLKAHVWSIEQDLVNMRKDRKKDLTVRI